MPLDRQVEAWLEEAAASGVPPMNELPVDESRAIYNKLTVDCSPPPEPVAAVEERAVPGKYGDIPVRIYRPEGNPAFPVVVYYHGGGWVLGDLDFAHSTATLIAGRAHAVVVTVDYRLAPEHPFPAPVDDAYSALRWVLDNPALLDADVERVAVAGDSAGGNLAAVVALMARNDPGPRPVHQLLLYPVTDLAHDTESARAFADGPFLTMDMMRWFRGHYLTGGADPADWRISPLRAPDLRGAPPAHVITAEYDLLRDEGEAYAARLREAGVPATVRRYDGQIHGFAASFAGVFDGGRRAIEDAAWNLRNAFRAGWSPLGGREEQR